jgi:hypothetical protein
MSFNIGANKKYNAKTIFGFWCAFGGFLCEAEKNPVNKPLL